MATNQATKESFDTNNNGTANGQYGYQLEHQRTIPTHAAFGGAFQPGVYNEQKLRKFANVAPLGLSAFALTTFILSLVNCGTRGVVVPDIVIGSALAYGGLVQLLAGMWEVAIGNTFGAVALSSYGGFWISFAITIIPSTGQGFGVVDAYKNPQGVLNATELNNALGFYLIGWWIFTTLLLLCTLKSTVAFFSLFFFLDITFLLLALGKFYPNSPNITKAGGVLGVITAFIAWYNALAGMLETSNSFFTIPVVHFPWSDKVRNERRANDAMPTA